MEAILMRLAFRILLAPIVLAFLLVWTVVFQTVRAIVQILMNLFSVTVIMVFWAITGEQI
jgi:hypothetical protein